MSKIALLGFGGTIASSYDPIKKSKTPTLSINEIIDKIEAVQEYEIEAIDVKILDSSQLNDKNWIEIVKKSYEYIKKPDISGVVITHGTDTMGYSAAALSFAIQKLGKPIIITGSQRTLNEPNSDSEFNLLNAINLAKSNISGVYVAFGGLVIQGTRAVKTRSSSYQAFESINFPYISPYLLSSPFLTSDRSFARSYEYSPPIRNEELKPDCFPFFEEKIYFMDMFPNRTFDTFVDYLVKEDYQGIVIKGYGLGNIPSTFTNRLGKEDVKFHKILSTQCRYEGVELNTYELGRIAKEAGIISARDMPPETALVKLKWLVGYYKNVLKLEGPFDYNLIKADMHRAISCEIN